MSGGSCGIKNVDVILFEFGIAAAGTGCRKSHGIITDLGIGMGRIYFCAGLAVAEVPGIFRNISGGCICECNCKGAGAARR